MIVLGITDHVEGPRDRPSGEIYAEVAAQTELADGLGFEYAWFAEHHAHVHQGHLPAPLLLALHLCGEPSEFAWARRSSARTSISRWRSASNVPSRTCSWAGEALRVRQRQHAGRVRPFRTPGHGRYRASSAFRGRHGAGPLRMAEQVRRHPLLPLPRPNLGSRCWVAVNSVAAAGIAGRLRMNMLFSHLRTPEQYRQYVAAYRTAGGGGLVAADRPVHVAKDDATAFARIEPALRSLWRRFQSEGKIAAGLREPSRVSELCPHPINFIVGGPETVARQLLEAACAMRLRCREPGSALAGIELRSNARLSGTAGAEVRPLLGK